MMQNCQLSTVHYPFALQCRFIRAMRPYDPLPALPDPLPVNVDEAPLADALGASDCEAACNPAVTALATCCALFLDTVLWAMIPAMTLNAPRIPARICPQGTGAATARADAMAPVTAPASPSACVVGLLGTCMDAQADPSAKTTSASAKLPKPKTRPVISTPMNVVY
jgi:hypothetical protein